MGTRRNGEGSYWMTHISLDMGSTHMGKKHLIREAVETIAKVKREKLYKDITLKFQLFPDEAKYTDCGNIHMPLDLFTFAYQYGSKHNVAVTASIFGEKEADFLTRFTIPYVKFAYSMRDKTNWMKGWLSKGVRVISTTNFMERVKLPEKVDALYTYTEGGEPVYPVQALIDFEKVFIADRFVGFSDHTLGWKQTCNAIRYGAKWIEKHITPPYNDVECPDRYFALNLHQLDVFVDAVKKATETRDKKG